MPRSAKKPCNHPGCGALTTRKQRYCTKHQQQQPERKSNWNHKKTSTERGYGYAWQKLRVQILRRDDYLCQPCLEVGRITEAKQVDHKIPKSQGGTDDPDNLQSICDECHGHKTATERR